MRRPRDGRAVQIMLRFIIALDVYELVMWLVERLLLTGSMCLAQCSPLVVLVLIEVAVDYILHLHVLSEDLMKY